MPCSKFLVGNASSSKAVSRNAVRAVEQSVRCNWVVMLLFIVEGLAHSLHIHLLLEEFHERTVCGAPPRLRREDDAADMQSSGEQCESSRNNIEC